MAVTDGGARRAAYTDVLAAASTEYGTNLMAALEEEWTVHGIIVGGTAGLDVDIHWADV